MGPDGPMHTNGWTDGRAGQRKGARADARTGAWTDGETHGGTKTPRYRRTNRVLVGSCFI